MMNYTVCTSVLAACLFALGIAQNPESSTVSALESAEPAAVMSRLAEPEGDELILDLGDGVEREPLTAYAFVGACQGVTGLNFTWRDELTDALQSRSIRLLGSKTIPRDRFYAFFELMMSTNGFAVELVGDPDIAVVRITRAPGQ